MVLFYHTNIWRIADFSTLFVFCFFFVVVVLRAFSFIKMAHDQAKIQIYQFV